MRCSHFSFVIALLLLTACSTAPKDPILNTPAVHFESYRVDSAFFNMDTTHFQASIQKLYQQYPFFAPVFFDKVLMLDPVKNPKEVLAFLNAYRPIYLDAQKINVPSFAFSRIKNAFTRFHYYFPEYTLPKKLVYFIGPLESYSNILFKDGLAIGLQMHLGSNAPWYYSEQIQTIYPPYMSRNFVPANVVVVSMQNILEDYVSGTTHTNTSGKTLLIQMIDAGKKQYILNQLLPQEADSTKWGYTNMQLKTLATEESSIFDYLLQQKILFSVAPEDSRNMMQMAANNSLFGASIPGDAGRFIGYKMVQSWMEKKGASINLQQLLAAPAENIYTESGYKP